MRAGNRNRVAAGVGLGVLTLLLTAGCSFNASIGDAGPAEDGGAGGGESSAPESDGAAPESGGDAPGAGGGAPGVPAGAVAREAAAGLEEQGGQAPHDLTRPADLPAEVGPSIRRGPTPGGPPPGGPH